MSVQNKAVVRRLIQEVWNRGQFAVADELVARDYVGHSTTPSEMQGREGYKQFYAALRRAFPDLQFTIEDQIAEGDRVMTRWIARGTHKGEFQGVPATGASGAITGITVERVADGKVVECWANTDDLGLMQQLGVIPAPERASQ